MSIIGVSRGEGVADDLRNQQIGDAVHPAASIEIRSRLRTKARVHVEPHPALDELTTLTFLDGQGTEFEITMSTENLTMLYGALGDRLDALEATRTPEVLRVTS